MSKPRLLDLFSGAGGAARGYQMAGFHVTGIDHVPQPRYAGDVFIKADALEYVAEHGREYDAIHASPPCQAYSGLSAMHPGRVWVRLIEPTRELLLASGRPFAIENVESAPLLRASGLFGLHGVMLCGTMFQLGARGMELRRHRLFESTAMLPQPPCRHRLRTIGVYGHGGHTGKHRMAYRQEAAQALAIDWMNRDEMTQAIPPAYTAWIGEQLMRVLTVAA